MRTITQSPSSIFVATESYRWLIAVVAVFAFGTADAQWSFEPIVRVGGEKDDNATLTFRTDDIKDVTGLLYDVSARVNYESAITDFFITPRVISRNYADHPEIDSDDLFIDSLFRRSTQFNTFDLRLRFDDQSVRTAERADADLNVDDPDDIPEDSSGIVGIQDNRTRLQIAPRWTHHFSNTWSSSLRAVYVQAKYAEPLQFFLTDYTDIRLSASLERVFSDRTVGLVRATARRYELEDGTNTTDGYGLMAGFRRDLSQTTEFNFLLGLEDTETSLTSADPEPIATISLRQRLETIDILALYRRSISASGIGKVTARDSYTLNLSRKLTEKVTAGIGARAYQTNALDDTLTIDERNYVQLRTQFIWNITASFAAELDYRYTFQKRSALPESSNSNQIMLWFSYQPNYIDRRFRDELAAQ